MLVRFQTIRKDTKVSTIRSNTVNIVARNFRRRAVKALANCDASVEDKSDTLTNIISSDIQSIYSKHRHTIS